MSTYDTVLHLIREVLEEHVKRKSGRPVADGYEKVVLALFKKAHWRPKGSVYTTVFVVIEPAAVKAFFSGAAYYIRYDKINKLANSQDLTQNPIYYLIMSPAFAVPVICFVKKQAENLSVVKKRSDNNRPGK